MEFSEMCDIMNMFFNRYNQFIPKKNLENPKLVFVYLLKPISKNYINDLVIHRKSQGNVLGVYYEQKGKRSRDKYSGNDLRDLTVLLVRIRELVMEHVIRAKSILDPYGKKKPGEDHSSTTLDHDHREMSQFLELVFNSLIQIYIRTLSQQKSIIVQNRNRDSKSFTEIGASHQLKRNTEFLTKDDRLKSIRELKSVDIKKTFDAVLKMKQGDSPYTMDALKEISELFKKKSSISVRHDEV